MNRSLQWYLMNHLEKAYKGLNAAQRLAVDTIDGPVLVIAGPGTGKTQLLSLRVANILRKTDTNPSNILCLTYTESGQQAMQDRLITLIGEPAKQVEIHTFHGFGTYLISHFSEYFPELGNFRPADDLALYETLRECFEKLPRSNPLAGQAYGQFTYQPDAANRIGQLKQAGITPVEAKERASSDSQWSKTVAPKITKAFNETGRLAPKAIPGLLNQLVPLLSPGSSSPGLAQTCLDELQSALDEASSSGKTVSLSEFKKKWFVSEEGKLYFKPSEQLKKLTALAELYGLYEAELQKRKLYDYDDMILYALEQLETNKEFRSTVQETFHYILADEYQDTNAAQARIITLIADNPVNEGRPNVMVVGDDDQAIYGFQGAMGDVLVHFRERWQGVAAITLKENYRSTQTILDTARAVIAGGQERLENYYEDVDKSLSANASYPPVKPRLFQADSADSVLEKAVETAQSVPPDGQLAIIATKHKYLRALANRLDDAKINYYYEGREDLLKDPQLLPVLMIAKICMAISRKEPAAADYVLPELITTDAVGMSRTSAWEVAVAAKQQKLSWWETMQASPKSDVKAAVSLIEAACGDIGDIKDTDGLKALQAAARHLRIKLGRKAEALVNHATTYLGREKVSLSELLSYVELCLQAGIILSQKIEKGDRQAPVRLLSAHKSKGLEFDRVYLLHADHHTWIKEKGRRNNLTLPANWQPIEPRTETHDDRLRLLYVVLTRAKQELGLIMSTSTRTGKTADMLPGMDDIETTPYAADYQDSSVELSREQLWQAWFLPQSNSERKELRKLLAGQLAKYRLSPTHLTMFLDIPHGGPITFLTHVLLGIPTPVHPEALFGSYVHKLLHFAQAALDTSGSLPAASQLKAFASEQLPNAAENQIADVVETVSEFLKHTKVLRLGGISEYSFSDQHLKLAGLSLTGTVDRYDKHGTELVVTDYKTGRALDSWKISEDYYKQKLHRFSQQLLFYEKLFKLSPEFQDIKSIDLKVVFVEPSKRGAYRELVLEASNQERRQLEGLMHAVWEKVLDVDLPDMSIYSEDYQGVIDFERDLLEEDSA